MAFGPSTPLLQQALLTLLQGRQASPLAPVPATEIRSPIPPVPLAPTGDIGPLSTDTSAALAALLPQPVPPPLPGPVDTDAIRARFASLAGPEPVAPVAQPDSLLQKISRALIGFGAGAQGRGPEYLEMLRRQREEPVERYKAESEIYQARKSQLGLMAEQEIGRAEDRRATRTQALLDQQADREFEAWARRLNIQEGEVKQRAREVFDLQKLREQERAADERQLKAQKLAFSKELAGQIKFYKNNGVSDPAQARRLALNDYSDFAAELGIEVPALTKGDNQRLATVQARLDRAARVGRGASAGASNTAVQRMVDEFNALKALAIQNVKAAGGTVQQEVEAVNRAVAPVVRRMAKRPDLFEFGAGQGGYAYAQARGAQPQASPAPAQPSQDNTISLAEIQAIARQRNQSVDQVRREAEAEGLIVR